MHNYSRLPRVLWSSVSAFLLAVVLVAPARAGEFDRLQGKGVEVCLKNLQTEERSRGSSLRLTSSQFFGVDRS